MKLESVDETVEEVESTYSTMYMAYAHSDLVTDAFVASGIHDVQLSLYAMLVCFGVLSVSVGLKFLYGILFMFCIILSLVIGAGALPLFGFSYFSAFNVLAIFVITGVGADAIIVFCSSWYKNFANAKFAAKFLQIVDAMEVLPQVDMLPLFPLVIYNSYTSVRSALTFTVMTTVLSFMANLVSPIIVIAQLGAFMGSAMIMYFILLHLVLIPAWVFVVKVDQYISFCSPCLALLSSAIRKMTSHVPSSDLEEFDESHAQIDCRDSDDGLEMENVYRSSLRRLSSRFTEQELGALTQLSTRSLVEDDDHRHSLRRSSSARPEQENDITVYNTVDQDVDNESVILGDEVSCVDDDSRDVVVFQPLEVGSENVAGEHDEEISDSSFVRFPFKKQNKCLGCGVLFSVVVTMILVLYGVTNTVGTDFGLPVLFKEGSNMADLMHIAKNYKSDLLSLSNSGGSSSTPDPGTHNPTLVPTPSPTPFPTRLTSSPTSFPTADPTTLPTSMPTLIPTVQPTALPTHVPTEEPTVEPSMFPTTIPTNVPTSRPTVIPTLKPTSSTVAPTLHPTFAPTLVPSLHPSVDPRYPTSMPLSSPSIDPTATTQPSVEPTSSFPSIIPSSLPSSGPSVEPTTPIPTILPSSSPSADPSTGPTCIPSGQPSSFPSEIPSSQPSTYPTSLSTSNSPSPTIADQPSSNHPTAVAQLAADGDTLYTVYVCHGIDIEKEYIDSEPEAKVNHETFGRYAEVGGLLADIKALCDYLASNKVYMEVAMVNSECLYEELMGVTVEDINIFERIGLWMAAERDRMYQVGVEETGQGVVSGNFGEELDLWLTWICQPISCRADISSFFSEPDHALTMIDRWDYALYDVGSASAESMDVVPLTGSEAWLFPLLSDRIVSSIYVTASISFVGCLLLIGLATRNPKLSLLIGFGMLFVMVTSLFIHAVFFTTVIDLIDVIVLISFVGIIIDYPTHMAFHFERDMKLRREFMNSSSSNTGNAADDGDNAFHKRSFGYMRVALLGPALTTVFSAAPLLFAEFSIISKAGEYVVIMCACTYAYVAFVMPTLLRLIDETIFCPCCENVFCGRNVLNRTHAHP